MADRCYIEVRCRQCDAHRFEDLGFLCDEPGSPIVELHDDEGIFDPDDFPKDIPYYGSHDSGRGSYGEELFVCNGRHFVAVPQDQDCGCPALPIRRGGVATAHVQALCEYLDMLWKVVIDLGEPDDECARRRDDARKFHVLADRLLQPVR